MDDYSLKLAPRCDVDRITVPQLIAFADEIDSRVNPIPGRRADDLARALRSAARQLAGIPHPTGSETFAAELARLDAPAPWRLCDETVGEVLAAHGGIACVAGDPGDTPEEDASELALFIVLAINTLSGFKAEAPK